MRAGCHRGTMRGYVLLDFRQIPLWLVFLFAGGLSAAASEPGYVGSESCRPCHAEAFAAWQGSDHDRAMMPASEPGAILGDFSGVRADFGDLRARFFQENGVHRVEIVETDGTRRTVDVVHAFGVDPLQQYLVRTGKGRLQALTLAWDSRPAKSGGQRWITLQADGEVPPGDLLHWEGAGFRWNQMCADCHSTAVRKQYDPEEDLYGTTFAEIDVGCEACHGPGAAHLGWARKGAAEGPRGLFEKLIGRGTWTPHPDGPRRVGPSQAPGAGVPEIQVCAPCHARRSLIADPVAAHGRFLDGYRPEFLTEGLYQLDGQILDEVYVYGSFLQSRMFAAGVSCSDCHEPHSLKLRADGNALCVNCHNQQVFDAESHHFHEMGSAGAQCVSCHMPERTYMKVDGRRDHSFRVPQPQLSHELGTSLVCLDCHTDRDAPWAERELLARGKQPRAPADFPRAFAASRKGDPRAATLLAGVLAQPAESGIARGTAAMLLGRHPGPVALAGLQRAAVDTDPLVRLGAAASLDSLADPARLNLGRSLLVDPRLAVRIEAGRALADLSPADLVAADRRALGEAVAAYEEAQRLQADWPQAHVNLGVLAARQGRLADARGHYEQAIRVGPDFVPGYVNLADTLRQQQDEMAAAQALEAGLQRAPGDPDLRHALGLSLVRQGDPGRALVELRQAANGAPGNARYAYVYAVALHSGGQTDAALGVLQNGLLRHPADAALVSLALSLSLQRNDRSAARVYARQMLALDPQNAQVAQLLGQLED